MNARALATLTMIVTIPACLVSTVYESTRFDEGAIVTMVPASDEASVSEARASEAAPADTGVDAQKLECEPAKFGPRGDASAVAAIVTDPKNYWGSADLDGRDGNLIKNEKIGAELAPAACFVGSHGDAGWIGFAPPQSFIDGCGRPIILSVCLANRPGPGGLCSVAQTLAHDWKVSAEDVIACDGCVEPRGKSTDKNGKPCGIFHCSGGSWATASGKPAPDVPGVCFSSG